MIYNLFHIAHFKDIANWSVLQHQKHNFGYSDKYQLVPIGKFLMPSQSHVDVQDDVEYKQATVKIKGGGVFLRTTKKGKEIGTKHQWLAKKGQFILSKIDARNGAMGIIPDELDGAIVTHDFPLFDVKTDIINPQFLLLIITTDSFMKFAQSCSSGTTNRQRINVATFLRQRIPLPSLEQQNAIILEFSKKMTEANDKESNAMKAQFQINDYLKQKLGLRITNDEKKRTFKRVRFKDLTRWDFQYYKNKKQISSTYEFIEIGKLMKNFMADPDGETIRCNSSDTPTSTYTYIGMEDIEKETGEVLDHNEVSGGSVKSQTLRVPKGYIIYGKLRPYLNKYWLNETDLQNIICSSEFFVFDVKESVEKKYFLSMLASSFTQEQIIDSYSGARMPRINEQVFKSIMMPLPPQQIQQEIVDKVSSLKRQVKELRYEASVLREQASKDFERQIFSFK